MSASDLTAVMRVQIEIALAQAMGHWKDLVALEASARSIGLSGAEIDAAKRGKSFDAVIDVAVAYAVALHHEDLSRLALNERRLVRFGLGNVTTEIKALLYSYRDQSTLRADSLKV